MTFIYHITTQAAWEAAQQQGYYIDPSLEIQGFIHNSTVNQVTKVANAVFSGQSGLILLEIDPAKLLATLKYEPPDTQVPAEHSQGELFPHLYGRLNLDAVIRILNLPPEADGTFQLPVELH
jgi:uncharacterized protein (DUF952 family)